jgi:hypothetical protein
MRVKTTLLRLAILSLVVVTAIFATSNTYAYWTSGITGDTASDASTVTIGTWNFIPQWDPNATYYLGDRVVNNGDIYEAKRDFPDREPGVSGGWNRDWFYIGPA